MMIHKKDLDHILALQKAQPVGLGYIDVIVKQEYTSIDSKFSFQWYQN